MRGACTACTPTLLRSSTGQSLTDHAHGHPPLTFLCSCFRFLSFLHTAVSTAASIQNDNINRWANHHHLNLQPQKSKQPNHQSLTSRSWISQVLKSESSILLHSHPRALRSSPTVETQLSTAPWWARSRRVCGRGMGAEPSLGALEVSGKAKARKARIPKIE